MLFTSLLTLLTFSAMGIQPGASHSVITSTESDDCYMPCDEQGVWIGPRSDNVEDAGAALKRFEDELAEFERLGEVRWAATDNSAHVKTEDFQDGEAKARAKKTARRAERRAREA
ncbi:hypothetical protein N8I77_006993 [Diaporthe amygdali]|uniref:Uncharacterized protein n=1 Tax=Phomopsis amygdali TaxID=1214568 RepID=A0AAD9SC98_PHOAM|nr:hypothetical protein N8I77_006993 [Diaporthe amygdali]